MTNEVQHDSLNPYESPKTETAAGQGSESEPLPMFGLKEPIELSGIKQPNDLLDASVTLQGKAFWGLHFVVALIIATIAVVLYLFLLPNNGYSIVGVGVIGLALFGGYLYLVLVRLPRALRNQVEEALADGGAERFCFGEQTLQYAGDHLLREYRWEGIGGYQETDSALLIHVVGTNEYLVVPRDYSPNDEIWSMVRALLACKLPDNQPGQSLLADTSSYHDAIQAPPFQGLSSDVIYAAGQYTPKELRVARKLAGTTTSNWVALAIFAALFVPIVTLVGAAVWRSDSTNGTIKGIIFLFVGVVAIVAMVIGPRRQEQKAFREMQPPFEWREWAISSLILQTCYGQTRAEVGWSMIVRVIEKPTLAILKAEGGLAFLVPRSSFESDSKWLRFLELAREKTKN